MKFISFRSRAALYLIVSVLICAALTSCRASEPTAVNYESGPDTANSIETSAEADTKSEKPRIIACTSGQDSITGARFRLICGETEGPGYIKIEGGNIEPVYQYTGRTRFFIPIYAAADRDCQVKITFTGDGRDESEAVNYKLKKTGRNVDFANFTVGSGNNFIHWPDWADYACNNYLGESALRSVYRALEARYENIKKAAGDDTGFIILLMPDPLVLYDESASDELKKMRADAIAEYNRRSGSDIDPEAEIYTAMDQTADYINSQNPDFTLINMTPILRALKKNESYPRLYHTTDNHWSSLGAFYGYTELMNAIHAREGTEGTKPLTLDDFDIADYKLTFENMAGFSDPWSVEICEIVDLLAPKKQRTSALSYGQILNDGRFWSDVRSPMEFTKDDAALPTAVVLRDSFATALYPMLNEHFSKIWYGETWDFTLDYDWLASYDPDYVIIVAVERLAMSALRQR